MNLGRTRPLADETRPDYLENLMDCLLRQRRMTDQQTEPEGAVQGVERRLDSEVSSQFARGDAPVERCSTSLSSVGEETIPKVSCYSQVTL
jgi:hypothetical protein